ncbi:hypothetical protein LYSHEL_24490 [Lysobacter helvus]|uniref:CENP-V/GFA domain-containing protein n=2 Tax=Lysobacteraceae TaxID=32033 RepID=A0ABN6FUW4_9GAMM|nr:MULTISPECIES: hypothetical protein [Lysobacter]BCT93425.1 hypothetical protein LYSCAS_24490 [Lysobacter caseinilyticus]BCT96578.1 hypothetical protein LYSHEL_24490 [Lysobacter helvus]
MELHGACHCGNLRFDLTWPAAAARIPARACTCTFCRKHGATWTSHVDARLRVHIEDPAHIARYAFGTNTADFHVCTRCGVVPLATSTIDARTYAVVNINTFENIDAALFDRSDSSVEGESLDARLSRRSARWIADVQFAD